MFRFVLLAILALPIFYIVFIVQYIRDRGWREPYNEFPGPINPIYLYGIYQSLSNSTRL